MCIFFPFYYFITSNLNFPFLHFIPHTSPDEFIECNEFYKILKRKKSNDCFCFTIFFSCVSKEMVKFELLTFFFAYLDLFWLKVTNGPMKGVIVLA